MPACMHISISVIVNIISYSSKYVITGLKRGYHGLVNGCFLSISVFHYMSISFYLEYEFQDLCETYIHHIQLRDYTGTLGVV
jgi:hypothetical protein